MIEIRRTGACTWRHISPMQSFYVAGAELWIPGGSCNSGRFLQYPESDCATLYLANFAVFVGGSFLDFESGIVSTTVYRRNMSFRARWVWIFLRVQQRFNWNEDFNLNGRWQKVVHNSGMQLMIALAVIWKNRSVNCSCFLLFLTWIYNYCDHGYVCFNFV